MDKEDFKGKGWEGEKYKERTSRRESNVGGGKMENDIVLRLIWLLM